MTLNQHGIIKYYGDDKEVISRAFLSLGIKYLHLTDNVMEECMKGGNVHMVVTDYPFDDKAYAEATKWSDFNIITPVLFSFYHGLELIMKGLLFLLNKPDIQAVHGLSNLLNKLNKYSSLPVDIKTILERHIDKARTDVSLLGGFLTDNNLSIDQIYEGLRYPSDKKFQNINSYFQLQYQEKRAFGYFSGIVEDIKKLRVEVVKFHKAMTRVKVIGEPTK